MMRLRALQLTLTVSKFEYASYLEERLLTYLIPMVCEESLEVTDDKCLHVSILGLDDV